MLKVFICDDDHHFVKLMKKTVQACLAIENYPIALVLATTKYKEIIDYIQTSSTNGLYFLDIELQDKLGGIDVAREIRNHDPRGFIVMVSNHPDYVQSVFEYQIEVMSYLLKTSNNLEDSIASCIRNAYEKYTSRAYSQAYIFKELHERKISVFHQDILFFETNTKAEKGIIILEPVQSLFQMI